MHKSITLFLLLLSFVSLQAAAQVSSFEKGYIVQDADTLHGYIQNVPEIGLTKSIEFKKELNATTSTVYTPQDIRSFSFGNSGIVYAAVEAEIIKGSTVSQVKRFAKLMSSGYISLYKLPIPEEEQSIVLTKHNTNLYILEKENTYYTLGLYETLSEGVLKTNARYKGVLRAVFSDCKDYKDNLDLLTFNDKSIMDEVGKYNACMAPEAQTQVHTSKTKAVVKYGLEATYIIGSMPDGNNNYEGSGYAGGFFWDIIHPDKSRQISGKIGVGVMAYKSLYYTSSDFSNYNDQKITESAVYLRVPIAAQYNIGDAVYSKTFPFITLGVTAPINTTFKLDDFIPLQSFGVGMYHKRFRFAAQIENHKLSMENLTTLNFSVAVRLDQ